MTRAWAAVKRRSGRIALIFALAAGCAMPPAPGPDDPVRVAAAASLRPALEPLAGPWVATHPNRPLDLNFGASGTLFAQIGRGLPCDVFLSADEEFPAKLGRGTLFRFARGRLVLWVRAGVPCESLADLARPEVARVALANPRLAPYGRAAEEALRKAGLADSVGPKAARPGNVEEVAAALSAGAADAGFVPLSLARRLPPEKGRALPLPPELAAPVSHAGAALTHAGEEFRDFLLGPEGRAALAAAGFDAP